MSNFLANGRALRQATLLLFSLCGVFSLTVSPDSFDVPLKKKVVDLGPSPYVRGYRIKLSCYFYRAFVVMQFDEGEKGAEWLAIAPIENGIAPACIELNKEGQRIIKPDEWMGYFKGVKENLVFFDAADGTDGGIPFAVYDSGTGKKIFEDSAYESRWHKKVVDAPFNRLRFNKTSDGRLSLRYLRVTEADCDLRTEKVACWQKVRNKLRLKNTQMPICSDYKGKPTPWPSAIVEVFLFPQPSTKFHSWPGRVLARRLTGRLL